MDEKFNLWVKLIIEIPYKIHDIACPSCNSKTLRFQYVGDENSRMGYLDIWCDSCLKGIHLSRVKIPENIKFISFKSNEEILKKIPNFKLVHPN